jgi:hypothetical protein
LLVLSFTFIIEPFVHRAKARRLNRVKGVDGVSEGILSSFPKYAGQNLGFYIHITERIEIRKMLE